eukprot:TRINITY_DN32507_c0_g1_i1.p1 TRINITY_DN32507_c0_g1~~TRINITY_DN32507_c0_g1_i1.p1  ORF type:complete len:462 (+),score=65.09 TRINITY_DN32507_c0_g1_i1:177-1562(+)
MWSISLASLTTLAAAKNALVLVDVQECFLENGSLPVVASQIIPLINSIREQRDCLFDTVVKTQDYHPHGHISFGTSHGMAAETPNAAMDNAWRGAMTMKCINTTGIDEEHNAACCPLAYINESQVTCNPPLEYCPPAGFYAGVATEPMLYQNPACTTCDTDESKCFSMAMDLWLDHCLQDGDSTFATQMVSKDTDVVVRKGTSPYVEMFSGFYDNSKTYTTDLHAVLQAAGVTDVYVAGIATTHCVRWTIEDALLLGYNVNIIFDASAGIWGTPTSWADEAEAISDLETKGVTVLNTSDILAMACPAPAPSCLAGDARVQTHTETVMLKDLELGDSVFTGSAYEEVIGFIHSTNAEQSSFISIEHTYGRLRVSSNHLVMTLDGEKADRSDQGLFSPLTPSGMVSVDNVSVSNYATIGDLPLPHSAAHAGFFLARLHGMVQRITGHGGVTVSVASAHFRASS